MDNLLLLVGAPPYPDFTGCFGMHLNQDIIFLWALLIFWDARKYKYSIQISISILLWLKRSSVLLMLMLVPAIQACEQSWDRFSTSHILDFRPRWGQHLPNDSGLSRRQVAITLPVTAPLNLYIGVIYYLYLFGRSCARNEWPNHLWCSQVLLCFNIIVVKTLPVSWGVPFDFFHSF